MSGRELRRLRRSEDVVGLEFAMRDPSRRSRVAIVAILTSIGTPEAEAVLMRTLVDDSPWVRRWAVAGLASIQPKRDPTPILTTLWGEGATLAQRTPREVCESLLYRLRALDSVPLLLEGLSSVDNWTRFACAKALGELGDPRGREGLLAMPRDRRGRLPSVARRALREIDDAFSRSRTDY